MQNLIEARQLSLIFPESSLPLFSEIDIFLTNELHALIGRNGVGKSCLAAILADRLQPSEGVVQRFCKIGYLAQGETEIVGTAGDVLGISEIQRVSSRILNGEGTPQDLSFMDDKWNWEAETEALLAEGELSLDILKRPFKSLSGGEQTRLKLLALKIQGCKFLILDEPSNHLDQDGRMWLAQWLESFNGGVLLVSHDPILLERVQIVYELTSMGISISRGGWHDWLESQEQLLLGAQRSADQAKKELQQAKREQQTAQEKTEQRQSRGKNKRKDSNQSKIILDRELGRSEATQSRKAKLHDDRIQNAGEQAASAKAQLEIIEPLAIVTATPEVASNPLLHLSDVILPFGIATPLSLIVNKGERIAVTGKNGSGKSTLLKVVSGQLEALQGEIAVTQSYRLMDQHFSFLDKDLSALDNFRQQASGWTEDLYRTRLAQLRIKGDAAIKPVKMLSGGEQLKVALACLFCGPTAPALLLLDEPDNHLDIESKNLLQQALHDYTGAIILVSHDQSFIEAIGDMDNLTLNR
ncbi:ABC-F family ATP-binding cassette domain-containing protein [Psychrobacter faecalis]